MKKADLALLLGLLNSQGEIIAKIRDDILITDPDSKEKKSH